MSEARGLSSSLSVPDDSSSNDTSLPCCCCRCRRSLLFFLRLPARPCFPCSRCCCCCCCCCCCWGCSSKLLWSCHLPSGGAGGGAASSMYRVGLLDCRLVLSVVSSLKQFGSGSLQVGVGGRGGGEGGGGRGAVGWLGGGGVKCMGRRARWVVGWGGAGWGGVGGWGLTGGGFKSRHMHHFRGTDADNEGRTNDP
jgi:hypothetical protein